MKYFIICIISLLSCNFYCQNDTLKIKVKKLNDTIDYRNISDLHNYKFAKKTLNNNPVSHYCGTRLKFMTIVDSSQFKNSKYGEDSAYKNGDTLVELCWYQISLVKCLCCHGNSFGKLKINRGTNIIIIKPAICKNYKKGITLMFKVIKFSFYEIILEEINGKKLPLRYYFYSA